MSKSILVTGGAGFIGSHYIRYLLRQYPDIEIWNLDALTYSGNLYNLKDVEKDERYHFIHANLCKQEDVSALFEHQKIDEVVHFAAESHVDRSIYGATPFIETNIKGTFHLLEASLKADVQKFVHVSTDEVYGSFPVGMAVEDTLLAPKNPYSASKASSDLLCLSYQHTYGMPVVISRCTNNYGPNQYPEKLIPFSIKNLLCDKPIPIYGDGKQQRDWIHVYDHCRGLDLIRQGGREGEIYHIGAENTVTNFEIALKLLEIMDKPNTLIDHVQDRLGHDVRYALDTQKIRKELQFQPSISFAEGLKDTVYWYLEHEDWWDTVRNPYQVEEK
ncbi:dTDP-glucose 4,6-dehydratase [Hazenella sp. IB182357]|uniref:dTDP-glucose 4,6-dehydratase n=1 Tax=Polycladospora coralii TaxID=2771432 RepID=A0A926N641_9BACL|nr:dTDP-glucose 4,6-dehydratase [Polycladospora coralii]MBD1371576.1 dTDP-glucose 4,6-dehydratase [Polycladospora coralii]